MLKYIMSKNSHVFSFPLQILCNDLKISLWPVFLDLEVLQNSTEVSRNLGQYKTIKAALF